MWERGLSGFLICLTSSLNQGLSPALIVTSCGRGGCRQGEQATSPCSRHVPGKTWVALQLQKLRPTVDCVQGSSKWTAAGAAEASSTLLSHPSEACPQAQANCSPMGFPRTGAAQLVPVPNGACAGEEALQPGHLRS